MGDGKALPPLRGPKAVLAAYDLLLTLHPAIRSFPKSQQFVLGGRMQETALDLVTGLAAANVAARKREKLVEADAHLEKLRLLVRLSYDLKFVGGKMYEDLAGRVDEIGRMIGGWTKWTRGAGGRDEAGR
jgi:hypothetical protein